MSCTHKGESYFDDSTNAICTYPDHYGKQEDFWQDIESRLLKACASSRKNKKFCKGLDFIKE